MILVDSSVWIDYFRGDSTPESDRLLASEPWGVCSAHASRYLDDARGALLKMAPRAGLEPATGRLTAACSTN